MSRFYHREENFDVLLTKARTEDWEGTKTELDALSKMNKCSEEEYKKIYEAFLIFLDKQQIELAKNLLAHDMDVNKLIDFETLLHHAVKKDNLVFIQLLLEHHASVSIKDKDKHCVIGIARRKGNWEMMALLANAVVPADKKSNFASTLKRALFHAVAAKNYPAVSALLEAGADPDFYYISYNRSCFYLAVENNDVEIVKAFLKYNVNYKFLINNFTPLELAEKLGYDDIVELINKHHKDINTQKNASSGKIPALFSMLRRSPSSLSGLSPKSERKAEAEGMSPK